MGRLAILAAALALTWSGEARTVHAKDYGFDPSNSTAAIQAAIDTGAETVVIDAMPTPWRIEPIRMRSDLCVRIEKGARVLADKTRWQAIGKKPLFHVLKLKNVVIEGAGVGQSLIGCFESYQERMKFCRAGQELSTGIYIDMSTNVVVRNLTLSNCGCDGLTVGGWRIPAKHVLVEDVDCNDNHRQGCSVLSGDDVCFRRVKFRNTRGTEPAAGVDVEPCYDVHPLKDIVFEDCEFGNNDGGGFITPMSSVFPIDITLRRCTFRPEKGRSPIDILARGDTYVKRTTPADVSLLFEDCTVESYANDPAINFATGPIFSCTFRNLTIREVPGYAMWRPARKCSPVEFRLDRDYHGAFPAAKQGRVSFEGVTATGYTGRPFIQFVDTLGKQDVQGYFRGTVVYNGEKVDTAAFCHKAMDVDAPCPPRYPVGRFRPMATSVRQAAADVRRSNLKLVPWGDWYEHSPCYSYYFAATNGQRVGFSVVYPKKTDFIDFTQKLRGVRLRLDTPTGAVDLGELHALSNRFEYVATADGWHAFFPPFQEGEGNYVHVEDVTGASFAYQCDTVESGEIKFRLRDEKKDYVGYFEVPPNRDCQLRVSRGTVELRDASGRVVDTAVENEYAGRKIIRFRAAGDRPEIWSFRTPPGGGTRVIRPYAPLTGIWSDAPDQLPQFSAASTCAPVGGSGLKEIGKIQLTALEGLPLKARVDVPNVKPDVRCDAAKTDTYTMNVVCYKRRNFTVRCYNLANWQTQVENGYDKISLFLPERIDRPIWVDVKTGVACEIPPKNAFWTGTTHIIRGVPMRDTPIVVCDRRALPLVGETEPEWMPPPPQDIVIHAGEPKEWTGESVTFPGTWDLTQNRTIRIELENTCTNGGTRVCVMDQGTGRSTAWVPAGFKGTVDIDLLAPLEHPELRGRLSGMQSDPFMRATFWWTPEPQLMTVRNLTLDHVGSGKSDAPCAAYPRLIVRKVTALDTSKKRWPAWYAMNQQTFFPFIDRYGQFRHKEWPGKTHADSDLRRRLSDEAKDLAAHPGPRNRDAFGGWTKGPRQESTGRFRLAKTGGKWWFVDPEGNLWWSHGVVRVTPSSAITPLAGRRSFFAWLPEANDPFAHFYTTADELLKPYYDKRGIKETFDFSAANLCRKYGADWRNAYAELSHRRLRSWGLNTIANGSDRAIRRMNRTPYVERLETRGPKCKEQKDEGLWWHVPDPYSDEFRANLRRQLEANREELSSPWCLGLFVDNEHNWTGIGEPTMREYFKVIREEIKRLDPQLLYFGCRFANANPTVVKVCSEFADAVSFNRYDYRLDGFRLPAGVDKPVLVGEFHFGSISDTGLFKPSLVWTPDQRHRAAAYRRYVEDALDHPNVVGVHWHQFSDQATTGRFDGENANVGFTDVCDTPYAELVNAARSVGESMYERRWRSQTAQK